MTKDAFTDALRRTWQQARVRKPNPDELIQEFRRVTEDIPLENGKSEVETRGPGYIFCPVNRISNGSFETDLTGWTESIAAGITATTQRTIEDAYTVEGSLGALEVEITAGVTSGFVGRQQTITGVSPGEVWSFGGAYRSVATLGNCNGYLEVEFLDAADGWLESNGLTPTLSDWVLLGSGGVWNLTAPALTAKIRLSIGMFANGGAASGKVRWDVLRAERAATISTRLTRIIAGEWTAEAA